ncbi:hypothetical protein HDU96_009455 [Phlyctochytrium bullatum]|nr:hypothetical protein HDU96_009455 [Phlyctochytrium bullatum]
MTTKSYGIILACIAAFSLPCRASIDCAINYRQACVAISTQLPPASETTANATTTKGNAANGWNAFAPMCTGLWGPDTLRPLIAGFCVFCPASTAITDANDLITAILNRKAGPTTCRIAAPLTLAGTVFYKFNTTDADRTAFDAALASCDARACPASNATDPALRPMVVGLNSYAGLAIGGCACGSDRTREHYPPASPPFAVPAGFQVAPVYNLTGEGWWTASAAAAAATTTTAGTRSAVSASATASTSSVTKTSGAGAVAVPVGAVAVSLALALLSQA